MQRTSLEVAKQFNVPHCRIMLKIERAIKKGELSRKSIKEDYYIDTQKVKRPFYFLDKALYEHLVNWYLNQNLKKHKNELDKLASIDNLTSEKIIEKSKELDELIVQEQTRRLVRR